MEYLVKVGEMFLRSNVDITNYQLCNKEQAASHFKTKEEADEEVQTLIKTGIDKNTLSIVEYVRYEDNGGKDQKLMIVDLFNTMLTREDLEVLISETIQQDDSLGPIKNLVSERFPGPLEYDSYSYIFNALTPLFFESLGFEKVDLDNLPIEQIGSAYKKLDKEAKKKVDAITAIHNALTYLQASLYLQNGQIAEAKPLLNHLLSK